MKMKRFNWDLIAILVLIISIVFFIFYCNNVGAGKITFEPEKDLWKEYEAGIRIYYLQCDDCQDFKAYEPIELFLTNADVTGIIKKRENYIYSDKDDTTRAKTPAESKGQASIDIEVEKNGIYYITGFAYAEDSGANSFFIKHNEKQYYWNLVKYGTWAWNELTNRKDGKDNPIEFNFKKGINKLIFLHRETGAQLQRLKIDLKNSPLKYKDFLKSDNLNEFTINGLESGKRYLFAGKTFDENYTFSFYGNFIADTIENEVDQGEGGPILKVTKENPLLLQVQTPSGDTIQIELKYKTK